jgi:hypothetical protein
MLCLIVGSMSVERSDLWALIKCVKIYWYIKLLDFSEIVSYTETTCSTFRIVDPCHAVSSLLFLSSFQF